MSRGRHSSPIIRQNEMNKRRRIFNRVIRVKSLPTWKRGQSIKVADGKMTPVVYVETDRIRERVAEILGLLLLLVWL